MSPPQSEPNLYNPIEAGGLMSHEKSYNLR